jgi:hypothetical protein
MDAINLVYAIAGFVVGAVAVAVMVETRMRRASQSSGVKLTQGWRLAELRDPIVVAHDVLEVEVPAGARVAADGMVSPQAFAAAQVRQVPSVPAEFAIDAQGTRALVFVGGLRQGSWALLTVDPAILARLSAEAKAAWDRGDPYVERRSVAELPGRNGVTVETQGVVQDVLPYHGRHLMRLEDGGHVVGVVMEKDPSELRQARILVRGRVEKDRTGYTLLAAYDVRRMD